MAQGSDSSCIYMIKRVHSNFLHFHTSHLRWTDFRPCRWGKRNMFHSEKSFFEDKESCCTLLSLASLINNSEVLIGLELSVSTVLHTSPPPEGEQSLITKRSISLLLPLFPLPFCLHLHQNCWTFLVKPFVPWRCPAVNVCDRVSEHAASATPPVAHAAAMTDVSSFLMTRLRCLSSCRFPPSSALSCGVDAGVCERVFSFLFVAGKTCVRSRSCALVLKAWQHETNGHASFSSGLSTG